MIYSTNRTASIGEITVDVNESYFGAGALNFMQENAKDELALFEMAIKSDIDEVMIGESSYELEALHEGFVENAVNKIKEIVKKFIEWLKAITKSAIAKLAQLLVRDNGKFVKAARRMIRTMKNRDKFEYSGKVLKSNVKDELDISESKDSVKTIEDGYKIIETEINNASTKEDLEAADQMIKEAKENFDKLDLREDFEKECVEDVTGAGFDIIERHIKFLENCDSKSLKKLKANMKKMEDNAKKISKKADEAARKDKGDDEIKSKRLSVLANAASAYRDMCQTMVKDTLAVIKEAIKIARRVVAKAMGATPKNEGYVEPEMLDAMIEAVEYEYDEALEEMSEAKDVEVEDIDFDEDEEY